MKEKYKPTPPVCYGEKNGMSHLTEEEVMEIVRIGGIYSQRQIADIFNVCQKTVSNILNGRTWNWLTEIKEENNDRTNE